LKYENRGIDQRVWPKKTTLVPASAGGKPASWKIFAGSFSWKTWSQSFTTKGA